jgi:ubiquinone/menaquinone biosynthesis C-methylase UbiE
MKSSRIFDPAHITVLESEDRKVWQNPDEILSAVKFKSDWIAADFGCGSGYFTVLLAQKVKKVYAIDVQKEMLRFLEDKIRLLRISNIELRLSNLNEIPLEDEAVDFLMSVNTLHEFDDKARMVREMRRVVKRRGSLLIVDFKRQETGFGPSVKIRVDKEKAIGLFKDSSFALTNTKDLPYHYLLAFVKP